MENGPWASPVNTGPRSEFRLRSHPHPGALVPDSAWESSGKGRFSRPGAQPVLGEARELGEGRAGLRGHLEPSRKAGGRGHFSHFVRVYFEVKFGHVSSNT